jgi:hypothetical protein
MCRLGITIAPRGEMIMKSKMTVNCRNPRMPITTFSYRENLMRAGARVGGLSMKVLSGEIDPKALARGYRIPSPFEGPLKTAAAAGVRNDGSGR